MTGQIKVTVQTAKRLSAIIELAQAINKVADALQASTQVVISDCQFKTPSIGVLVETAEKVTETTIVKVDDDD